MGQHPIAVSRTVVESVKLPPRLEVYSLLASLARQRRVAALNESSMQPQSQGLTDSIGNITLNFESQDLPCGEFPRADEKQARLKEQ